MSLVYNDELDENDLKDLDVARRERERRLSVIRTQVGAQIEHIVNDIVNDHTN